MKRFEPKDPSERKAWSEEVDRMTKAVVDRNARIALLEEGSDNYIKKTKRLDDELNIFRKQLASEKNAGLLRLEEKKTAEKKILELKAENDLLTKRVKELEEENALLKLKIKAEGEQEIQKRKDEEDGENNSAKLLRADFVKHSAENLEEFKSLKSQLENFQETFEKGNVSTIHEIQKVKTEIEVRLQFHELRLELEDFKISFKAECANIGLEIKKSRREMEAQYEAGTAVEHMIKRSLLPYVAVIADLVDRTGWIEENLKKYTKRVEESYKSDHKIKELVKKSIDEFRPAPEPKDPMKSEIKAMRTISALESILQRFIKKELEDHYYKNEDKKYILDKQQDLDQLKKDLSDAQKKFETEIQLVNKRMEQVIEIRKEINNEYKQMKNNLYKIEKEDKRKKQQTKTQKPSLDHVQEKQIAKSIADTIIVSKDDQRAINSELRGGGEFYNKTLHKSYLSCLVSKPYDNRMTSEEWEMQKNRNRMMPYRYVLQVVNRQ